MNQKIYPYIYKIYNKFCVWHNITFRCFNFDFYMLKQTMNFYFVLHFAECNEGKFGQNCNHSCGHCLDNEQCNYINGTCPDGCEIGYQGTQCTQGNGNVIAPKNLW